MYDSGVYVAYLRRSEYARTVETMTGLGLVHLSIVVAEELLVGAPDRSSLRFLERLVKRFDDIGRLVVPDRLDWLHAGRAIREVARRNSYELVGWARLTNDALILATARRIGATVVTRNLADFARLSEHIDVTVVDITSTSPSS